MAHLWRFDPPPRAKLRTADSNGSPPQQTQAPAPLSPTNAVAGGPALQRHMSETFPLLRSPLQRPAVQFGGISTLTGIEGGTPEDHNSLQATPRKSESKKKRSRKSLSRFYHRSDAHCIPIQMLRTRYLIARRFRLRALLFALALAAVVPVVLHIYTDITAAGRSLRFIISTAVTASSVISAVVVYKLFSVKTQILACSDPLWYELQHIRDSPFLIDFLLYQVVFVVHAPPLVEEWFPAVRFLNLVVFLRFVVFFHLLKDYKFFTSFSTRVVSYFANAALGWRFAFKALLYRSPTLVLGGSMLLIWIALAATYALLEDVQGIESGLWFVFVTATTVGFGDIVPKTFGGRVIAFASAICGITASAFLVAIVRQSFDLQKTQLAVVDFMTHLHDQYYYRNLAAKVIQTSFRLNLVHRRPNKPFASWRAVVLRRKLFKLCKKLHSTRVTFIAVEANIFNPPDAVQEAAYLAVLQRVDELQTRMEQQDASTQAQLQQLSASLALLLSKVDTLQATIAGTEAGRKQPEVVDEVVPLAYTSFSASLGVHYH
eukprot:TRINITY_DN1673_c0_g1_i1.p2 TRINITY_DN1673_c0_g1~~TRINITY_DN1673_c0_g1_i1.p2  ORF type:complete len:556 (-),score=92.10 TRINITY_DN1673_c0_g1_i1:2742-4376(-)